MSIDVWPAPNCLRLTAINGTNPLGFLAALGTLVVARQSGYPKARLGWERSVSWIPVLDCGSPVGIETLCQSLADGMCGKPETDTEEKRKAAQRLFDASKKALGDKQKDIKKRRLRGQERKATVEAEILPLREALSEAHKIRLEALKKAVPRAELAIGEDIKCSDEEYRNYAFDFLEGTGYANRETVDLLAAFSCDAAPVDKSGYLTATHFCFVTGSGHQHFLKTVRELMALATPERIHAALFEPWIYRDGKYSLRWDPLEDRRYALMDRDPTALDNKSRTVWMANLLAYRALVLFPCAPCRGGLGTTAWALSDKIPAFTWPIWDYPSDPDSIRSLLQLHELSAAFPDHSTLVERGVMAAFRARRIQVGNPPLHKVNFSPARSIFVHHFS